MIRVMLFLMAGFLEIWLLRLNWLGRKKFGMYESSRIWRWFDRRGLTTLSLCIHFVGVTLLLSAWMAIGEVLGLAVVVGILLANAIIDNASIKRRSTCMQFCPEYEKCKQRTRQNCYKIWDNARRRLFR